MVEFAEKIEAAARARKSNEFIIIARTDAYAVEGDRVGDSAGAPPHAEAGRTSYSPRP